MSMRVGWWAVVVAVLALAASASPASAAFPGANGQLLLTPTHGSGVLIASPRTGRAHRVCDAPQRCGAQLRDARFSPNGRELVVRDTSGRIEVTTANGSCVWCRTSTPQWDLHGASPAFTAGATAITYVQHGGLWQVTPGRSHPTRLPVVAVPVRTAPVSAVVWSPSGKPAVVRRGWLWIGVRRMNSVILVRRVGRGSAPAWSPDGQMLAFAQDGFISMTRLGGHKETRVARGSNPAFSPDGRSLAYLNLNHQVTIRPLGHGRTRTLTRLRGRSLDWQPVTAVTRRGCAAANGVVVASTSTATIRQAVGRGGIGWNGCLSALGIPVHLNSGQDGYGYNLTLGHVALAGTYAAMQFIYTDKYMDYSDRVSVYDLRNGTLVHSLPVPCQGMPCDVTSLAVNAHGFAAWHAVQTSGTPEGTITAISCPTAGLCVAGDHAGDLLVSTAPTGGRAAWTRISVAPPSSAAQINGVSCPTTALCVAITSKGNAYWSTDPTGGAAAWHAVSVAPLPLTAVSCASASLCVAVGFQTAFITIDPTGPASAWSAREVGSMPSNLQAVSCASNTLCVIGDSDGELLASTNPADPATPWISNRVSTNIAGVDCPTTGLCVAVGMASPGAVAYTTTDPTGNTWAAQQIDSDVPFSVTCTGTSLCLVLGRQFVAATTDPASASPTWAVTTPAQQINIASCPTASLCIGAGLADIFTSSTPAGGPSAWTGTLVDALACAPCLSETLTAIDDRGAPTVDTAPPGPGTHIADLGFTGNTLIWTHDGAPRSAVLR